ncbi:MAG: hypothetical protein ACHQRL_04540, partial [Gemmatimonadales bacterium]
WAADVRDANGLAVHLVVLRAVLYDICEAGSALAPQGSPGGVRIAGRCSLTADWNNGIVRS